MGKFNPQAEQSAAAEHYRQRSPILSPAEECECGDEAGAALVDEIAEKLRARGVGAGSAAVYAEVAYSVMRGRDAKLMKEMRVESTGAMGWLGADDGADRLLRAISRAREARKSKLALGCWLFAMGRAPYGLSSERDLAREQEVSPEAVSQEREAFQVILNLPRAPHQKSAAAVRSYVSANGAKRKAA